MPDPLTVAAEDDTLAARLIATQPLHGVSGGSALLRLRDRLLAVSDDSFRLTWIALPSLVTTPWPLRGDGAPLGKHDKPDFESAVLTADGLVHVLSSGCTEQRRTLAQLDPATGSAALSENPELYACVQDALELAGPPNIEGAVVTGDVLRLYHRGVGATLSASADLPLGVLYGAAPRVVGTRSYELGALDGVPLTLTDVAALPDGRQVFVAAAEHTADAVADGPVSGSVIGLLDERPRVPVMRWTRLLGPDGRPCRHKVEGVAVDDDLLGAWLLTDADGAQPSELARVELAGFA